MCRRATTGALGHVKQARAGACNSMHAYCQPHLAWCYMSVKSTVTSLCLPVERACSIPECGQRVVVAAVCHACSRGHRGRQQQHTVRSWQDRRGCPNGWWHTDVRAPACPIIFLKPCITNYYLCPVVHLKSIRIWIVLE